MTTEQDGQPQEAPVSSDANRKDVQALIREITAVGWTVRTTRKGYVVLAPDPTVPPIHLHSTPSGHRYLANKRAELRRNGCPLL
jgi:hypothetical protein